MSDHCDFLPLPTNYCATLIPHLCCCWHCYAVANSASALQLPLNCCYCNREASEILNQLSLCCICLLSIWLLLASTLSTKEFALLLTLHWAICSAVNTTSALLNTWLQLVCNCHSGMWLHQLTLIHLAIEYCGPLWQGNDPWGGHFSEPCQNLYNSWTITPYCPTSLLEV